MIPDYNIDGNLPEGIYLVEEEEFINHFSSSSARRKWLGDRMRELLALIKSTGQLDRIFVWGSFVSAKESPNDVDMLLLMKETFQLERISEDSKFIFDHVAARIRFHIDIFWSKSAIGEETLRLWLDTYQMTKDFKRRGIVEVKIT
ncbi:MAG: hypothetical protein COZ69_16425 [Deltaproteobacteria bacterium CG_4_8_14_3_um_filter_45_9]|jgi:predicted nucleotidyltransferase|nr:MAG: hypothetical protein COS40_10320 [Deltaproteobacteria bacterium CG03_land_8_20_14_0_80_45_14]PIX21133.1 MAG: hypothetical protein COZ69_16425 [Deltaproteobacteria bacterium CG_4_8_14_3_um_filter_45_9]